MTEQEPTDQDMADLVEALGEMYPAHDPAARRRLDALTTRRSPGDHAPQDALGTLADLTAAARRFDLQWAPPATVANQYQEWMDGPGAPPLSNLERASGHAKFAERLLTAGDLKLCMAAVIAALKLNPDCALAEAVRAEVNRRRGATETAEWGFARARELDPEVEKIIAEWRKQSP